MRLSLISLDLLPINMKIYPVIAANGTNSDAFEIENAYISIRSIAKLLNQINDVTSVRSKKLFSSASDIHIEFNYRDQPYVVWEPFGDNSRYWIGPRDERKFEGENIILEQAFISYKPPFYRSIIGDIMTLRLFTRLFGRDKDVEF
jgi:hypothetical protein